jgi:DNA polymerase-3 subunit beta
MKIALSREPLLAALDRVVKVAPTSKSVPILNYVRLEALLTQVSASIELSATDLVTSITVEIPGGTAAAVGDPGVALVHGADFLGFLRSLTTSSIVLTTTPDGLLCRVGNTTCLWKAPPLDTYPAIPDLDARWTHTLPRTALLAALRSVKPAAALGSFNPNLEQVAIRSGKVQAADGIRFHQVDLPGADLVDVAFPLPFLEDVVRSLATSTQDQVELGVTEGRTALIVRHDRVRLSSRTRREPFPDVEHAFLIPSLSNTDEVLLSRENLTAAIRRVRIMSDLDTRAITLALSTGTAAVSARTSAGAWAVENIPVTWLGPDRTLTFNHDYLLHLLALFDGPDLVLRLGPDAKHKPSTVLVEQADRCGVLMQLRTLS